MLALSDLIRSVCRDVWSLILPRPQRCPGKYYGMRFFQAGEFPCFHMTYIPYPAHELDLGKCLLPTQ
jgi:hypothetical protein